MTHIPTSKLHNRATLTDTSAEITLYGDVVETRPVDYWTGEPISGSFICVDEVVEDLVQIGDREEVTIRLSSLGGDLYAGLTIFARLKDLKAHKTLIVDGVAASAATIIMMGADVIKVHPSDVIMIHQPSVLLWGYYNQSDLKEINKNLNSGVKSMVEAYAAKTGMDQDKIRSTVMATTWMTGREAVDAGYADELMDGEVEVAVTADLSTVLINGVRQRAKGIDLPEAIKSKVAASASPAAKTPEKTKDEGVVKNLATIEELRAEYPGLIDQIESAARQAGARDERERIRGIDEISATVMDAALVESAKYGEAPMTAEALAFASLKAQSAAGTKHLAGVAADAKESNVSNVTVVPPPGSGEEPPEDKAAQDIKVALETVNKMKRR